MEHMLFLNATAINEIENKVTKIVGTPFLWRTLVCLSLLSFAIAFDFCTSTTLEIAPEIINI